MGGKNRQLSHGFATPPPPPLATHRKCKVTAEQGCTHARAEMLDFTAAAFLSQGAELDRAIQLLKLTH